MKLKKVVRLLWLFVGLAPIFIAGNAFADSNTINVAGYEAFPGLPCAIEGENGSCGVRFYGWFGGEGAVPNGWVDYTGEGRVVVRVNYIGDPAFGSSVAITGGTWRLTDRGTVVTGAISGGAVTWPLPTADIGCGDGIAKVEVDLADSDFSRFDGCLHDFEADGTIAIPPKIWGAFQ